MENKINDRIIVDAHQEILDEYIFRFLENEKEALEGKIHVFDKYYKPVLDAQGVNFVNMSVGGDHVAQVMYSNTDKFRFWDAHKKLDALNSEIEAGCNSFIICKSKRDIDDAINNNKIGLFLTIDGGRPLEGKPNVNLLSSLRSLYRMGLRGLQLTGNGRNRLGDGVAQERAQGKLTGFGRSVVEEADRLGIVLDSSQLSDASFYNLVELTKNPIIDSHTCSRTISDHVSNISDDRIKQISQTGGVVGISFWASQVAQDKKTSDMYDVLKHIDHVINIAGIDNVALGPNYSAYKCPVRRDIVRGLSNLGPDFCEFDYQTPAQSEKYPGWIDGVYFGIRDNDFIEGAKCHTEFSNIVKLIEDNYSKEESRKILGENILRVYRQVLL